MQDASCQISVFRMSCAQTPSRIRSLVIATALLLDGACASESTLRVDVLDTSVDVEAALAGIDALPDDNNEGETDGNVPHRW